ncbi:MAG TPA: T9SS type A sorting domain-containing protein [Bacteroidales bacterium]|nr:T9SS type A sorting domain-containing protein [Bacteroidales bacterium]
MKKALLFAALFVLTFGSGIAQTVFYSDFETWDDANTPANWIGAATNITLTDVDQYTTNPYAGTYSMQINNDTSGHKRVSTKAVSVTNGVIYNVSYYVRGTGEIRSCIYKGATGRYTAYSSYAVINSTTWTKVTQTLISDTTSATSEFVLSVRNTNASNDHLQVDSFYVSIGTSTSVSIHDIQYTTSDSSSYYNQPVNTGGVVTAVKSGSYWVQNGPGPWNGIYVYDNTHTPAIGDSLTFSAIVDEYKCTSCTSVLTELKSVGNYVKVSSGNTVDVTPSNLVDASTEAYEGVLISVSNVECTSLPDTYLEWMVGDGMNSLKVGDAIFAYTPVVGTFYDITGVMDYAYNERKILPRSAADVTIHNAIDETEISSSVYPNPASDFVTVSAGTEGTLKVIDMTGRVVYSSSFSQSADVNVSGMEPGIYNVMINGNDGEFAISKLIVK